MVIHRQSVPLVFFKAENLEYSEIICIFDLKMRSKIGYISENSNIICFFARFALSLPVVTTNHDALEINRR